MKWTILLLCGVLVVALPHQVVCDGHYLNSFAVQVHGGREEAELVARDLGFQVQRELPNIGVFLLDHPAVNHRSKRSADDHLSQLKSHPMVRYVQQEVELVRVKRRIVHDKQLEMPIREIKDNSVYHRIKSARVSTRGMDNIVVFNDPYFEDMWYLENRGQSGGEKYLDMNVQVAWANGFTGEGVVVCILDDGIQHTHPDLAKNYDPRASADLNDKSDIMHDPTPNMTEPGNSHGTRCAGEIAASADNRVCGVGIAYNARIGGVRILDGAVTDALEGEALRFNSDYIDIYSASWGPNDDGKTMEAPHKFAAESLKAGVQSGRNGLGNIYVWATGNGGMNGDNCNADGYTSSIETLSVGSITDWGKQPFYMENCTSTLAVVPTGGEEYKGQEEDLGQIKLKVVTTDVNGGCIENFQGTSSAAPLAAGCLANVLQANPDLTWRDVQHVVVHGTRIPSVDSSWTVNGRGHHVSHKFGFGLIDCGRMVKVAQDWQRIPEQHVCHYNCKDAQKLKPGEPITQSVYVDGCKDIPSQWIQRLEHVQVHIKLSTPRRGDTRIFLISPSGTKSELLSQRPKDDYQGEWEFTFMTVHCWDEDPEGTWKLEILNDPSGKADAVDSGKTDVMSKLKAALDQLEQDDQGDESHGYISEWNLILYGTSGERYGRTFDSREKKDRSYQLTEDAVMRIKRDETETARNVHVKRTSIKQENVKRINANSKITSDDIDALAEKLHSLLQDKDVHNHVKRILNVYSESPHSQTAHVPPDSPLHTDRSYDDSKDQRNSLHEVVRDIEQLLSKKEVKSRDQVGFNNFDSHTSLKSSHSDLKENSVLKRVAKVLSEYLEKSKN